MSKKLFFHFLVDILTLGSESVDSNIVAAPDPGSQNLADPTDPDPTHCQVKNNKNYIKLSCL